MYPQLSTNAKIHAGSFLPKADSKCKRPFVVLKGKDGERKLSSLSVFAIDRQLKALVDGELKHIQKLGSGELLIQCKTAEQAQKLKLKSLVTFPVWLSHTEVLTSQKV